MAKKASDNLQYYHNPNDPTIAPVSPHSTHQAALTAQATHSPLPAPPPPHRTRRLTTPR